MRPHRENTHVINDLQNPIYADGLKDIVVAACPDGIWECGKEHAEDIKKAVENLSPKCTRKGDEVPIEYMMTPSMQMTIMD